MIRCYPKQYAEKRYAERPKGYREAMTMAIVEDSQDRVCFETSSDGWRKAKAITTGTNTNTGRVDWHAAAKRIIHGMGGLIKVRLGIDVAEPEIVRLRLEICNSCEKLTEKRKCGLLLETGGKPCGCAVNDKVKLSSEQCPLDKW